MKYVIVNDCDEPTWYHVAEGINGKYYYMARSIDGKTHLKRYDGMNPSRPTRMQDFGFSVVESEYEVLFKLTGPSIATYEDGVPRKWQGTLTEFIMPKVVLRKRKAKA